MNNEKVVIPVNLRQEMLERIHRGHQGIEKCIRRARNSMRWPDMGKDIEGYVNECEECIKARHTKYYPFDTS